MRKIISREVKERKEKRNKIIVSLILVGIMVLGTVGYAFYNVEEENIEKVKYNGIDFVLKEDGLWHFSVQEQVFSTVYNPGQTKDVVSDDLSLQNFPGKILYYSQDSNREGLSEIIRNIGRFAFIVQEACLNECEEDLPVKNCTDNIIIVRELNESLIKQEDNCVYILGSREDIIKASDAFVYKFLGVQ